MQRAFAAIPRKIVGNHSNVLAEVVPSFALIFICMTAGMGLVGGLQHTRQYLLNAPPRRTRREMWDYKMQTRDTRMHVRRQLRKQQEQGK